MFEPVTPVLRNISDPLLVIVHGEVPPPDTDPNLTAEFVPISCGKLNTGVAVPVTITWLAVPDRSVESVDQDILPEASDLIIELSAAPVVNLAALEIKEVNPLRVPAPTVIPFKLLTPPNVVIFGCEAVYIVPFIVLAVRLFGTITLPVPLTRNTSFLTVALAAE